MKIDVRFKLLFLVAGLFVATISCTKSFTLSPTTVSASPTMTPGVAGTSTSTATSTFTGTATFTPNLTASPTPTATPTFTLTGTPTKTNTPTYSPAAGTATFTPTPTTTFVPPMGLWVVGVFVDDIVPAYSINQTLCSVYIAANQVAETTDAVTLITPGGSYPVTYASTATYSTYSQAMYTTTAPFIYTPNGNYSVHVVSTSLGTADATVAAPGNITITTTGSTGSAVYPGNFDSAVVEEISPSAVTTLVSSSTTSVGSPYSYPSSAYPASPATYGVAYSAGVTDFSVTGPNVAVGSVWVGDQVSTAIVSK